MKIFKYIYILIIFSFSAIVGCAKQDISELSYDNPNSSILSSVAVFNAIPQSTGAIIKLGDSQKTAITSSDRLFFGNYVTYKNWFSGNFNVIVENQSNNVWHSIQTNVFLATGRFYSLFLYNNKGIKTLLSEDDILSPSAGKVKIRVAHLGDNLANVNVESSAASGLLFRNIKYETVSEFIEIDAALLHNFTVQSVDGEIKLFSKEEKKLENKGIYTILIKGYVAANGNTDAIDFSIIKQ